MSFADVARSSLRNNKLVKQKMFGSFEIKEGERVYKTNTKNPHIKNMSKKELKAYRKDLQKQKSLRMVRFGCFLFVCFY